jgi:RNA polymerase sigma-70 factor (ECF subfamily)
MIKITKNYLSSSGDFLITDEILACCTFSQPATRGSAFNAPNLLEDWELSLSDDQELTSRCLSGDEASWSSLYRRLYKTVHFITHWHKWNFSPDQADEIMQDVFLGIVSSLKTFQFECSLETFASNIAKNKCISEIRRLSALKREGAAESLSADEADADGDARLVLADPKPSFSAILESAETSHMMKSALDELDEQCRTIVRLKYYDDYSYEDIAALSHLPLGTVASRLKRCLLELKRICKKYSGGNFESTL